MNKLTLRPGEAVKVRDPKTCWQRCGGTIVDVWPDHEHPEESIVGVVFPRGGFVREGNAFKAKDLLPFEPDSDMTKNNRTLHLVLKRKWWDMIASGEKPDEYRNILFWCVRLLNVDREGYGHFQKACKGDFEDLKRQSNDSVKEFTRLLKQAIADGIFEYRDYDVVCFHLGYTNVTMLYEFKGTSIGYGNPAWGAPEDEEVFIIKSGKRL